MYALLVAQKASGQHCLRTDNWFPHRNRNDGLLTSKLLIKKLLHLCQLKHLDR